MKSIIGLGQIFIGVVVLYAIASGAEGSPYGLPASVVCIAFGVVNVSEGTK